MRFSGSLLPFLIVLSSVARAEEANVLLVTLDGVRWQEVFTGADEALFNKEHGGVQDVDALKKAFWRDTPEARREALMPFLWGTVAKEGQLFGNRTKGSDARLTNGLKFSYPGYNEILTGHPDPRIKSNDRVPNPNVNVLEWLNRRSGFEGRIAVYGSWDRFPFILNRERSGLFVVASSEPDPGEGAGREILNVLKADLAGLNHDATFDTLTFYPALGRLREKKPRVLYIAFGETDEHAHDGRYDLVLRTIHLLDGYLRTLWEAAQAIPEYRGRTTLLVTTDHGRGVAPEGWKGHGANVEGAEFIWIGAMGPGIPALGERANTPEVTQSQVAATVAARVGEDWCAAEPQAGKPLPLR